MVAGARGFVRQLPVVEALGIVGRHRTREHELHVGNSSRTIRYASMTPIGSFHGSNRLTCTMSGSVDVDAVLLDDLVARTASARSRFFTDSGSMHGGAIHDVVHVERRGNELRHRPHRRVVLLDERPEELEHLSGWRR